MGHLLRKLWPLDRKIRKAWQKPSEFCFGLPIFKSPIVFRSRKQNPKSESHIQLEKTEKLVRFEGEEGIRALHDLSSNAHDLLKVPCICTPGFCHRQGGHLEQCSKPCWLMFSSGLQ